MPSARSATSGTASRTISRFPMVMVAAPRPARLGPVRQAASGTNVVMQRQCHRGNAYGISGGPVRLGGDAVQTRRPSEMPEGDRPNGHRLPRADWRLVGTVRAQLPTSVAVRLRHEPE